MSVLFSENVPEKFNIFVGELVNRLTKTPTTHFIYKELFSLKEKDYILINNNLSLPEISQNLLDKVIMTKEEIIEEIRNIFTHKAKYNSNFYGEILRSNLFSSIITTNYDYIIEDYFLDLINKITPFSVNNDELDRVSFYKIYGDLKNLNKFALTTQDIKRLKILSFYEEFWNKISLELSNYPTILFGINFNDSVFMGILEYVLLKAKNTKPLFLYVDQEEKDFIPESFIKKYSIKIIEGKENNFLKDLESYFPELKKEGDASLQEYA